ncbi:LysR family transcriptional regulator [Enorma massiliensis]|uniref:LysR family transcriptional regulator n=1 Tax=Enorma massiliensis TaxID=1472761 RepID=UPI00320AF1FA
MNTMQLSCFVEVAAQLSFSKAAEALHVSQPTVSHQIKVLEDELGCALLVRSTRTVRLTDDGFAFLEYANDIHPSHADSATTIHSRRRPPHRLARRAREAGAPARDPRPLHRDPDRGAATNAPT